MLRNFLAQVEPGRGSGDLDELLASLGLEALPEDSAWTKSASRDALGRVTWQDSDAG